MAEALRKFFVELPDNDLKVVLAALGSADGLSDSRFLAFVAAVQEVRPFNLDELFSSPKYDAAMKLLAARVQEVEPSPPDAAEAFQSLMARIGETRGESWDS